MRVLALLLPALVLSTSAKAAALTISSPAFPPGGAIPARFTCEGKDVSPALQFSGVPKGTRSLVLIVTDPDAPDPSAPTMTWTHWVIYDIPPGTHGLQEAADSQLPTSAHPALNDFKRTRWGGPCPPIGRHRYFFRLYALKSSLGLLKDPTRETVEAAMQGLVLAQAELVGTYEKTGK